MPVAGAAHNSRVDIILCWRWWRWYYVYAGDDDRRGLGGQSESAEMDLHSYRKKEIQSTRKKNPRGDESDIHDHGRKIRRTWRWMAITQKPTDLWGHHEGIRQGKQNHEVLSNRRETQAMIKKNLLSSSRPRLITFQDAKGPLPLGIVGGIIRNPYE